MRQREREAAGKRAEKLVSEGMTVVEVLRDFNQRRYLSRDWSFEEVLGLCKDFDFRDGNLTVSGQVQEVPPNEPRLTQIRDELTRYSDPVLANRMALTLIDHYLGTEPSK